MLSDVTVGYCDNFQGGCHCNRIVRYNRIGVVGVTEASVVIAVSSPHRRDALDAVNFAIEELKARNNRPTRNLFYKGPAIRDKN